MSRAWARWWRWALFFAYLAAIFAESSCSTLPQLPGNPSDKLEHGAAYAVMAALFLLAAARGRVRQVRVPMVVAALLVCTVFGWSDELHQLFVPNREYDLKDLAADAAGASLAAVGLWAWGIIARGRERNDGV